jgi:hypothetical protein
MSRPRGRAIRVLSSLVLVAAIGMTAYSVYGISVGAGPPTATATVISVHPGETHRRVYDVTFVTADGQRCSTTVSSGLSLQPVTDQPNVGDTVRVRYQAGPQPCAQVSEAGPTVHPVAYVVPFVLLVVASAVAYASWLSVYRARRTGTGES